MLKKRIIASTLSLLLLSPLVQISNVISVQAETETPAKSITRVQGADRFKTSVEIAKKVFPEGTTLDNVILTSGYDFPDGLSGSTLAKKLNAPILMAGKLSDSQDTLDYIYSHLKEKGNVYILGGIGAVSKDIEDTLNIKGYNVIRLAGQDRIETNNSIIKSLNAKEGTPVFIANAYSFPDALSVSSIAAIKGYPILLTSANSLPSSIEDELSVIKPSIVYIVGGTGVVSSDVENSIKTKLPSSNIQRISGANRYETSMNVFTIFSLSLNTNNVVLASGKDFPDALCGSQLAAKLNASIVLADENNLDNQQVNYTNKGITNFYILGGTGAVSGEAEEAINFDKDAEIANITNLLNTYIDGLNKKDINQIMSTIDPNTPKYDDLKKRIQDFIDNSDGVQITIDYINIDSLTRNTAEVTYSEAKLNSGDLSNRAIQTLKKINGKWYIEVDFQTNTHRPATIN